jgi:hypothetical protein
MRRIILFSLLIAVFTISARTTITGEPTNRRLMISLDNLVDSDSAASQPACEKESTLRSKEGVTPVEFTLLNRSKSTVVLYWINYEGKRVKYEEIGPNLQVKQPTYLTHPWVVADTKGRCLRVLTPPGDFVIE